MSTQKLELVASKNAWISAGGILSSLDLLISSEEPIRSITLDLSSIGTSDLPDFIFSSGWKTGIQPALKTVRANGKIRTVTLTFTKPLLLSSDQTYALSIANVALDRHTLQEKVFRLPYRIGKPGQGNHGKDRPEPVTLSLADTFSDRQSLEPETTIAGLFERIRVTCTVPGLTQIQVTADSGLSVQLPIDQQQADIDLITLRKKLALSDLSEEHERQHTLHLAAGPANATLTVVRNMMWYEHVIDRDNILVELLPGTQDDKIWTILASKSSGMLELWCCSSGTDWKKSTDIDWKPLQEVLNEILASRDRFGNLKDVSQETLIAHIPPAILRKTGTKLELLFIGGSKHSPAVVLDTVFSCEIPGGAGETSLKPQTRMKAGEVSKKVAGHTLALFPYETHGDCIWVLFGMDSTGNATRDIALLAGDVWMPAPKWGLHQHRGTPELPLRCLHQSMVHQTADGGNELWITGGFDMYAGNSQASSYRYRQIPGEGWKWELVRGHNSFDALSLVSDDRLINTSATVSVIPPGSTLPAVFYLAVANYRDVFMGKLESTQGPGFSFSPKYSDGFGPAAGNWAAAREFTAGDQKVANYRFDRYPLRATAFKGCIWLAPLRLFGAVQVPSSLFFLRT